MLSIDHRIRSVFREVFDREDMEICDKMTARDVPDWDSFAQVKLIIGIEEEFGIKFTTRDVDEMSCVGDVKKIIINKGVKG